MNNIHISYTLFAPGQNYARLIEKIKTLGSWAHIHDSFWYVKTNLSALQVVNSLWPTMDANDSIYVVNATDNTAAWENLKPEVEAHLKQYWNSYSDSNR